MHLFFEIFSSQCNLYTSMHLFYYLYMHLHEYSMYNCTCIFPFVHYCYYSCSVLPHPVSRWWIKNQSIFSSLRLLIVSILTWPLKKIEEMDGTGLVELLFRPTTVLRWRYCYGPVCVCVQPLSNFVEPFPMYRPRLYPPCVNFALWISLYKRTDFENLGKMSRYMSFRKFVYKYLPLIFVEPFVKPFCTCIFNACAFQNALKRGSGTRGMRSTRSTMSGVRGL